MFSIIRNIARRVSDQVVVPHLIKDRPKIFCIGRNKTGTTSLKRAFEQLGFIVGNQRRAERLIREYRRGNFDAIIKYCKSAQVFQDVPFSYSETFRFLDRAFPGSKFILTVRDNPEQWYLSLTKFHAKRFGNGRVPTADQLKEATYVWKGWMWENFEINYGASESDPYEKKLLIDHYEQHNREIINYFKDRPQDLLVLNVACPDSYQKFVGFFGIQSSQERFPWENRTASLSVK